MFLEALTEARYLRGMKISLPLTGGRKKKEINEVKMRGLPRLMPRRG